MSNLIIGVGLFGPLVVFGALVALEIIHAVLGPPADHDDADTLGGIPHPWAFTLFCAGALAVADPIVAAVGYHAPLGILGRTALGGALAGLLVGRALALGHGAGLMVAHLLWPAALPIGFAIHMGIVWLLVTL